MRAPLPLTVTDARTPDAGPPPEISVVISTFNRATLIGEAVASVLAQEGAPPFDVTVVDNNSTDDTRAVVQALGREDARVRYVFEGRQGVSHGRNAGIVASRGATLAFTDDDVRVRPDWLAVMHKAFAHHPWADFVGGKVTARWPGPVPAWLTPEHWAPLALLDYGDQPVRVDLERPVCLVGCNLAFRRAALERAGLFDAAYQHGPGASSACEDQELELRILRAGGAGLYVPDMVIEAEVQPNRLTRAYHRKWHVDHGKSLTALLGPGETFDARMLPVRIRPGRPTFWGAALWAYRAVATGTARGLLAWAVGRRDDAFRLECDTREAVGHIAGCRARRRATKARPFRRETAL